MKKLNKMGRVFVPADWIHDMEAMFSTKEDAALFKGGNKYVPWTRTPDETRELASRLERSYMRDAARAVVRLGDFMARGAVLFLDGFDRVNDDVAAVWSAYMRAEERS